jgi:hypothetical protein
MSENEVKNINNEDLSSLAAFWNKSGKKLATAAAIVEGVGGPKARAVKGAVRIGMRATSQAVNKSAGGKRVLTRATMPGRTVRNPVPNKKRPLPKKMNRTTTGQGRKTIPDREAKRVAVESVRAPFGRIRTTARPNSGRGLSASEKARDAYYKSKQNPVVTKRGEPKQTIRKSQVEKDFERRQAIRKAISGKPGKRAPEKVEAPKKPLRTIQEVLAPLKGKKVVVNKDIKGKEVRMDAQEYVLTRANFRAARRNPENSVAPRTRAQEKTRADKLEKRIGSEERKQYIMSRLERIRDIERAKTNPVRYSSPSKEPGNIRQTEGLVAQGEKRIQTETARRRVEQEKIARTPRRKKQVEATLQREKNREKILAETRKKSTITRRGKNK